MSAPLRTGHGVVGMIVLGMTVGLVARTPAYPAMLEQEQPQQLWDFPYGGAPQSAPYPYAYPAGAYPAGYPQLPYRGEYPYSYPSYPGPYPYNGYPSNFVFKNRVGLDAGDGNRDGVWETYEDNDHALRDYTAREQYRQWGEAQERGEYDAFLRRNYFSSPSDSPGALLHEVVGENGEPAGDEEAGAEAEGQERGNDATAWGDESAEGSGGRQLEEDDGEALWNARGNQ